MANFVGVDFSMTSPAICLHPDIDEWYDSECIIYSLSKFDNDTYQVNSGLHLDFQKMIGDSSMDNYARFEEIRQWALSCIPVGAFVMFEDYAMGAKGRVFHIAENTGITKHSLIQRGDILETVSPGSLKKWATGRGNAKKEDMCERFYEVTGIDMPTVLEQKPDASPCSDIVDAYFLCRYFWSQTNSETNIAQLSDF